MALLQRELIGRQWITRDDFALAYSLARITPGTNILAFCAATGARVLGLAGAFAAVLAVTLPSAILAVLLTRGFETWRDHPWPMAAVAGTVAAVSGMMWASVWSLVKPYLGLARVTLHRWRIFSSVEISRNSGAGDFSRGASGLFLDGEQVNIFLLYALLLKATLTSFSGLASLPMVRNDLVVERKVLTDRELNTAVVAGRTAPGPNGLYLVSVGYYAHGLPGATAALLALMTPAFLIVPMMRWVGRRAESPRIKNAIRAVTPSQRRPPIIRVPALSSRCDHRSANVRNRTCQFHRFSVDENRYRLGSASRRNPRINRQGHNLISSPPSRDHRKRFPCNLRPIKPP